VPEKERNWVWRCTSICQTPNQDPLAGTAAYLDLPGRRLPHAAVRATGDDGRAMILPPAIDPLAPTKMGRSRPRDAITSANSRIA